jgi:hypothetical protein
MQFLQKSAVLQRSFHGLADSISETLSLFGHSAAARELAEAHIAVNGKETDIGQNALR